MNCKICLGLVEGQTHDDYHDRCLKKMFGVVLESPVIPLSRKDFMQNAPKEVKGFSISGVQVKLQARVVSKAIEVVGQGGDYIVKPCPETYPCFPENEHVSMLIHAMLKMDVAVCGLFPFIDGELALIVKRYDRNNGRKTQNQEDMSSMLQMLSGDTNLKYNGAACSQVLACIYDASKGRDDQLKYIKRLLVSYVIGNGDYHLKNISMVYLPEGGQNGRYQLSPVYDVLNTAVYGEGGYVMCLDFYEDENSEPKVFSALGNGYYGYEDFVDLSEYAGLSRKGVDRFYKTVLKSRASMVELINRSYLPDVYKERYVRELDLRFQVLDKTLSTIE
jgi:serine/threonine-protein kinase HipA